MARTKGRGRTPEAQAAFPGVLPEIERIPSLTRAVHALRRSRAAYQEAGMEAKAAGERVVTLMHEHEETLRKGLGPEDPTSYRIPGMVVTLTPGREKIKITTGDEPEEGDAEVEEE